MGSKQQSNQNIILKLQHIVQAKNISTIRIGKLASEISIDHKTLRSMLESVLPKATINTEVSKDNIRILIRKLSGNIIPIDKKIEASTGRKKPHQFVREISSPIETNRRRH